MAADLKIVVNGTPTPVYLGENTVIASQKAAQASASADAAALSEATAESAAGPTYPDTSAGLAATTNGQSFAVDNGDGTVTIYLNDGGVAVAQRTLATTAALRSSSGGELVGSQRQGDASAVTLDLNKRLDVRAPIPEEFGAKAGDDSVDSATGIQAAMLNFGYPLARTDLTGLGLVEYKTGIYFTKGTVIIPQGVGISGKNAIIMPHPDAVATDFWPYDGSEAYAFLHNCDTDGNQIVEGGGDALPTFEDLRFFNFPFYDAGKSPEENYTPLITGFKAFNTKGHTRLFNIQAHGMYGLLNKTASGSANSNYNDQLRVERVYFRRNQGDDFMINDETQGDAVFFDDLEHSPLPGTNHKLIYLAKTKGGTISRVQNGIIVASRCSALTMQNMHIEKGYIESRSSDVSIVDSKVFHNKATQQVFDPVSGADLGFQCPIRHFRESTSLLPGMLRLANVSVESWPGNSFDDGYVEVDAPDLLIEAQASMKVDNFFRSAEGANFDQPRSAAKISRYSAGSTDAGAPADNWENVAHHAAKSSYYAANRISIGNSEVSIPASYANPTGALSSSGAWKADSDTYYYRVVLLHGPKDRLVARTTAEFSATPAQDGDCVLIGNLGTNAISRPGFTNVVARVYRGTATGSYDKVVDVPWANITNIFDLGYRMSTGEAWKSRSAGGIDTFNTSASLTRMIVRDEINCTLFGTTGLPTVGTWVRGDEFRGTDFIARHNGTAWVIVDGAPVIVDDMGDAHYNAATCRELIVFAKTPLTTARNVNLPAATRGMEVTVIRTAASTGASLIAVRDSGGSALTTLAADSRASFVADGTTWVQV